MRHFFLLALLSRLRALDIGARYGLMHKHNILEYLRLSKQGRRFTKLNLSKYILTWANTIKFCSDSGWWKSWRYGTMWEAKEANVCPIYPSNHSFYCSSFRRLHWSTIILTKYESQKKVYCKRAGERIITVNHSLIQMCSFGTAFCRSCISHWWSVRQLSVQIPAS